MAVLECNNELMVANTQFSLRVGGSLVSEALVESAEEVLSAPGAYAWFPADHREGARFGVAVANPSNQPINVSVWVSDLDLNTLVDAAVNVPANSSKAFFVDELGTDLAGRVAQVLIFPPPFPGPSVYAIGLRFTGLAFTTIPALVYPQPNQ